MASRVDRATGLTPKQEKFCRLYFETGNAAMAYVGAYDVDGAKADEKKPEGEAPVPTRKKAKKPAWVYVESAMLLQQPAVQSRLAQMLKAASERSFATKNEHLADLMRLRTMSIDANDFRAAVKAEELRGRALGYYVEKKMDIDPNDRSHWTLEQIEAELEASNAALAAIEKAKGRGQKKTARKV